MLIQNVKIIKVSNKTLLFLTIGFITFLYFFYVFNSCIISSFHKAFRKHVPHNPHNTSSSQNSDTQIIFGSVVRIVSLTDDDNKNESAFKYRLVNTQNLSVRRFPDVLIIGVKKSGTRALLEFIRLHPDVRAAGNEIHFFDRHYSFGLNWYRKKMPPTMLGQLTMEKTPSYFITTGVPARVHKMNPNIKLLLVVRNPVTRAISDYTQAFSKKKDMKKFEELSFVNGSYQLVDTSYGAIKIGVYAKYLERWLKFFPLKQFLFISGERLISDPAAEIYRVQDFLNLKRVITEKHFYFNSTKGFPCLLKSESRSTPHCLGKTKGRIHPVIDEKAIERLNDFYRPFNEKFYQMTFINFGWS
ncbi:unnamed protein product [Chironomus riparius]|uniref:Sulfotransferase domain-containing protein n=1 Tax=Chironomus riparius TaxID=315576 RepID=A0A9P0J7I6_9DIPT|nr:unnamed protein product [Chironomus riparius]